MSFPELPPDRDVESWCRQFTAQRIHEVRPLPARRHVFTHFALDIHPVRVILAGPARNLMEGGQWVWYNPSHPLAGGLAAPVARLLAELDILDGKEMRSESNG